jgi:hypothetical protein
VKSARAASGRRARARVQRARIHGSTPKLLSVPLVPLRFPHCVQGGRDGATRAWKRRNPRRGFPASRWRATDLALGSSAVGSRAAGFSQKIAQREVLLCHDPARLALLRLQLREDFFHGRFNCEPVFLAENIHCAVLDELIRPADSNHRRLNSGIAQVFDD